jgi:hypothetical protein
MPQALAYTKCPQLQGNYMKDSHTSLVWAIALGKVLAPMEQRNFWPQFVEFNIVVNCLV